VRLEHRHRPRHRSFDADDRSRTEEPELLRKGANTVNPEDRAARAEDLRRVVLLHLRLAATSAPTRDTDPEQPPWTGTMTPGPECLYCHGRPRCREAEAGAAQVLERSYRDIDHHLFGRMPEPLRFVPLRCTSSSPFTTSTRVAW
jgi:hypothetical protein